MRPYHARLPPPRARANKKIERDIFEVKKPAHLAHVVIARDGGVGAIDAATRLRTQIGARMTHEPYIGGGM